MIGRIVCLAASMPAALSAQPISGADSTQILKAVLAHEAKLISPDGRKPICVPLGNTDEELHFIRTELVPQKRLPSFEWGKVDQSSTALRWVPGHQMLRLTNLAKKAIARKGDRAHRAKITASMLVPPLVARGASESCSALTLTTPSIVEDTAFVETAVNCGSLCGGGVLYALQRKAQGWEIVAINVLWAS